jgi:3-isopropylmalate dehydrogenase
MKTYHIALLPGDGVGPEVSRAAVEVLETAAEICGFSLDMQKYTVGNQHYLDTGKVISDDVFQACKDADAILMGALGIPRPGMAPVLDENGTEVTGHAMFKLRFDLDLYAGVRPIRLYPGINSILRGHDRIDFVVLRENCEGLFASYGGGNVVRDSIAFDTQVITRAGTEKISRFGFELALKRNGRVEDGKSVVTCAHKANVFRTFAFMVKVFGEVAGNYAGRVEEDYAIIDALTLWMLQRPEHFDVILTENAHGDIISDMAAAFVGGMGMAPSGDIGDAHAMFQPSHGTAPDITGKGIANPTASILSGRMMLEWLAARCQDEALAAGARLIEDSLIKTFALGCKTVDVEGTASTEEFTREVIRRMQAGRV